MLEEDREAIRRMKADFEAIAELTEGEFKSNTGFARRMNHYSTVYTAATRTTNLKSTSDFAGYYVDELLYMDFQEMLTRYLLKYRDLRAQSEIQLFTKVLKVWEHYKVLMKWNMRAFAYLSRFYIVNCSKPSLQQVALSIFLEQILKKNTQTISRVTQELLSAERNGEGVNRDQIRSAIELLSSVSIEKREEIYAEQFLRPFLVLTKTHYDNLLSEWSKSSTPSEFLRKLEQVHSEEKARCACYFSSEDRQTIMLHLEEVLLESPVTIEKLLKSNDGFIAALKNREEDLLKSYYNLLSRRTKCVLMLSKLMRDEIITEGEERLLQPYCEDKEIDFKSCVSDMMRLQDDFLQLLAKCFNNHVMMLKAIREGLEKVYSGGICASKRSHRCVPFSELLAYYADAILQGNGSSTDEEKLDQVVAALTYVADRDTFLAHSRDLLAKRILFPRKKIDEVSERSFVQRVSQRCGVSSTSYLEGMLHDLDVAEGFNAEEKLESIGKKPKFSINVLVLKKGIWPTRIQSEFFTPPSMIKEALNAFQTVYLEGTTGRVLTWSYSNSSGDVNAVFKKGTKTLLLTGPQCWVILAFNSVKVLTPNDAMNLFGMSLEDLKPVFLPLLKCSILCREVDSANFLHDDKFLINEEFSSKWKKVRVPTVVCHRLGVSHGEKIAKEVDEDRKPAIDACLVRIMKSRRVLSHSSLLEECHQKLSSLFLADPKMIKQRIEELIRKEYIERDQKSSDIYRLNMKLFIEDVAVLFPYEYIYPEQLEYMTELKKGLDMGGHMVLEMPSGTGKTTTLLSLLIGYLHHHADEKRKVVYCTRTVEEMTKTLGELRKLLKLWDSEVVSKRPLRGLCLTAKKNLCIETSVASQRYPEEVDAGCRNLTAPWQKERRCVYFDNLENAAFDLPAGAYSVEDLKRFGEEHQLCPYYVVRKALRVADIVVHSFLYIVDPIVAEVTKEYLNENTIVVMDEGHNVDDVCIEAMSLIVTKDDATQARENVKQLNAAVDHLKATNRQQLQDEYDRLVNGLAMAELARSVDNTVGSVHVPNIPLDIAEKSIPGSLRQANHFLTFIQRLVDFTHRVVSRISRTYVADPLTFLTKVRDECAVDIRHLRYLTERLKVLMNTLQITNSHKFRNVSLIAQMYMTLSTYYTDDRYEKPGFVVVCEAHDPTRPTVPDPVIRLVCVDASLALREAFSKYKSVVLTSGTLSPLDIYPKMLGFTPVIAKSFQMTLSRKCIAPVIVTRSTESVNIITEEVTSSFSVRTNPVAQEIVSSAYEDLLRGLAKAVPDGIVCFFTGYQYMGEVLLGWHKSGFLKELAQYKLIFVETQSVEETSVALANYRRACDIGRGAVFMAIARGKIAEGIDFDRHYGRAVVMFGVPFLPPNDEPLRQRIHWMETCLGIPGNEYRNFDAMRQASQCIGRVLRNKTDYGMMLLVDRRFALNDKRKKLPIWIQQCLKENTNLSVDASIAVARGFFKEMAQPWEHERDLGTTLFSKETLGRKGYLKPSKSSVCLITGSAFDNAADPAAAATITTTTATATVITTSTAGNDSSKDAAVTHEENVTIHAVKEPEHRKRLRE